MNESTQVVVIGAGITGLTLGHSLTRRGIDARVLEAAPQAGGVIQTLVRDGFTLEQGPFSVMVRSTAFGELLGELGLTALEVDADASKKRYVIRNGQLCPVPTSFTGLLTTPLLSLAGRLRLLRGVVRSASRTGDVDETVAQVAARRLGPESAEYLAGPATVGIFAAEADELSFDACIPRYAQADRTGGSIIGMMKAAKGAQQAHPTDAPAAKRAMIGFDGGLQTLIDQLVDSLGDRVRLDCPVSAVEQSDTGYRVTCRDGRIEADAVVCAVAPWVAAELLECFAPGVAKELSAVEVTGLGVVHLGFRREDVGHALDGFGFLIPKGEGFEPLLGSIWASSIFKNAAPPDHVLIRAIVGGTRWPEAMKWSHDALIEKSYEALKPLLGFRRAPVLTQACCWPRAVPVYRPGHAARCARVQTLLEQSPGLWCGGNWAGGLGVNDRVVAARETAAEIAAYAGQSRRMTPSLKEAV